MHAHPTLPSSPRFDNIRRGLFGPLFALFLLSTGGALQAESGSPYKSVLFENLKPVYSDSFDGPTINSEFWEIRQNTTWLVREGVLVGAPSSKEFQAKKKASTDPSHAGLNPVIWLKKVPENFVCAFRICYSGAAYEKGFPLLDIGHHIHTVRFSEKTTALAIRKDVETLSAEKPVFSLNEWHGVVIELKKGRLLLSVDGVRHVFESPNIDMTGQHQIDFKGLNGGQCEIDDLRLWEGL